MKEFDRKYADRFQYYGMEASRTLSTLLDQTHWEKLVDLGCGDGALLHYLVTTGLFDDKAMYAVDISPERLALVNEISSRIGCIVADVSDSPLKTESIDLVVSTQVIEHVSDDNDMVRDMYRLLAPGGTLYLTTVFKKWYGWYFYRSNGKWTIDPTHVREYSNDRQLFDKIEEQGFKIETQSKTLDSRPLMDAVLRRIYAGRRVYDFKPLRFLRKIKLPIFGYYIWEIVCKKP